MWKEVLIKGEPGRTMGTRAAHRWLPSCPCMQLQRCAGDTSSCKSSWEMSKLLSSNSARENCARKALKSHCNMLPLWGISHHFPKNGSLERRSKNFNRCGRWKESSHFAKSRKPASFWLQRNAPCRTTWLHMFHSHVKKKRWKWMKANVWQ